MEQLPSGPERMLRGHGAGVGPVCPPVALRPPLSLLPLPRRQRRGETVRHGSQGTTQHRQNSNATVILYEVNIVVSDGLI